MSIFYRGFLAVLFLGLCGGAFAIPSKIAVSGHLSTADDPTTSGGLSGTFPLRVDFYEFNDGSGESLTTIDTTVTAEDGHFVAVLDMPTYLLLYDRLYYLMAVDLDGDGFGEEDYFDTFFEIYSVPFSMSGLTITSFETGFGHNIRWSGSVSYDNFIPDTVVMMPFSTPPAGVRFNRLASRSLFPGTSSYGIYDDEGDLICSTDGRAPDVFGDPYIWELEGSLEPSRVYFAAYTTNQGEVGSRTSMVPTLPSFGRILDAGEDGRLPETVDFGDLQAIVGHNLILSFGLYHIDAEQKSAFAAFDAQPPLATLSEEVLEQIRRYCETNPGHAICADPLIWGGRE